MLSGGAMRTCQNNRIWSEEVITCRLSCPDLTSPIFGQRITYSVSIPRPPGATATYSCTTGYEVSGNTVRTCTAGGWDSSDPTCTPVDCGSPPVVTNGMRTFTATTFQQTATYSCNTGYQLSRSATVTCQANRSWSTLPSCPPVDCLALPNPDNGMVNTPSGTTFMNTATYSCNDGYTLNCVMIRMCAANGNWSNEAPVCDLTPLRIGEMDLISNNSALAISLIGEGPSALTCHTELSSCCRDTDNPSGEALGQWVGPDGRAIPKNINSGFYISRDTSSISLNLVEGSSGQGGSYCCVLPRSGGVTLTTCVLVEIPETSNLPPRQSVEHLVIALVVIGVILVVAVAVIVVLVTSLTITARQLRNARTQLGRVDSQTDNVVYEEPTLTYYEEVDRKPGMGGAGPSAIELNQCPAYQVSGQGRRRDELIYDN